MMLYLSRTVRVTLSAALLAGFACTLAHAQPDGGGRDGGRRSFGGPGGGFGGPPGGFGGGPGGFGGFDPRGGLTGTLRNEQVQQELGLTEEQKAALQELEQGGDGREMFRDSFDRMRDAQTDEERQQIQAEMAELFQARQKEREDKVRELLGPEKSTRLEQLSLQRAGTGALFRDDVAESLGLEQAQRDKFTEIGNEYRIAREELGRDASDEDRQKLRDEFNEKYLAVMTESQRAAWTEKLGTPATYDLQDSGRRGGDRGFGAPPGGAPPGQPGQPGPQAVAPAPQPMIVMAPPEGAVVVSSFGAPAGEAADRGNEASNISFNFRYAPWVDVLKLFADRAGFTLDLNTVPPGTFNYYDDGTYTITEALDILNGYLIPKGYILVRRDRFLVCINLDDKAGIPLNLVPNVDRAELYTRGLNELMTVVFTVEGANIDDTVKEVSQLLGPQGKPVGLKSTNSIVVTDIGSSLRRIDTLLQQISAAPESTVFKSYPLTNIAADEAEITLRAMLGLQVGVSNISAGSNGGDRGGFDPRDPRSWDRNRDSSRSSTTAATSTARLYAELRTNSIMVTATPAEHKIVEAAIEVIDIDEQTAGSYVRGRRPYLVVYEVNDSDPQEVVKTLSVLIPGVVVNEDGRNEKIHIMATDAQHKEVAALIRQLDGMGGGEQVVVIPLVKMDPVTASITLRSMFVRDGESAPTIEPDLYGRQLMIRGNAAQLAQAQQILTQLGEDGTGVRKGGAGGLSTFSVYGRDPDLILEMLQKSALNPIRIVRPKDRGPVEGIRTPGRDETPVEVDLESGEPSASVPAAPRGVPVHLAVQTETRPAADDAAPPATPPASRIPDAELDRLLDFLGPAPQPAANPPAAPPATTPAGDAPAAEPTEPAPSAAPTVRPAADPNAPVTITVMGDDLLISTDDPATRARVEAQLEELMQAIPPSTSWTIFPLEYADVTTTAAMLEQLFPDSTVASADSLGGSSSMFGSLTSGISSMTSSLSSMTGLSGSSTGGIRMIPYPPDNSLFVSGPTHKVREVEAMLKILDSGELSASLRDRTPRMIPVRYADIDEVLAIVKDAYKDALETEQDRGARNAANMFAQMMGGGGRRGGDQGGGTPAVALTIAVDRQTSQLIVSSSQSRFEEIKALVEQVDQASLEARQTVRVITLQNTSTAQLQNTISSLMPRVKVSTTGSRTSSSSSSGSSSSNGPSTSGSENRGPDQDQMRRMMEERMRAMQQQGGAQPGGNNTPFGGGRPSFGGGGPFGGGGGPFGGGSGDRGGRGRD